MPVTLIVETECETGSVRQGAGKRDNESFNVEIIADRQCPGAGARCLRNYNTAAASAAPVAASDIAFVTDVALVHADTATVVAEFVLTQLTVDTVIVEAVLALPAIAFAVLIDTAGQYVDVNSQQYKQQPERFAHHVHGERFHAIGQQWFAVTTITRAALRR